ncbi:TPA: hypothetical protein M2P09_001198 [Klebsiella quasipneumoniae]|nr:hypothetical protein [Klebsiella quasipneumoniae]
MIRLWLGIGLVIFSGALWAECALNSTQRSVEYSPVRPAERQQAGERPVTLPEKQIVLHVQCDKPQRIRLFFGSAYAQNGNFAFGNRGEMQVTAGQAVADERGVRLSPVRVTGAPLVTEGEKSVPVVLNEGIAFVQGEEIAASQFSVVLYVTSMMESHAITDRVTYHGNLQVRVVTP